jgi:hypothetical protein
VKGVRPTRIVNEEVLPEEKSEDGETNLFQEPKKMSVKFVDTRP